MGYIEAEMRGQVRFVSLEEQVADDHIVRIIDKFCETLDYAALGFMRPRPAKTGRPGYEPRLMVALYLFGATQATRSSRKLEVLTKESLPALWLLGGLHPDFKTIADFRKDNTVALTAVFDEFASFLAFVGLYGREVCAIDGTKIRASNSKKRNVSRKRTEARLKFLREEHARWLCALDEADGVEAIEEAYGMCATTESAIEKWEGYKARMDETQTDELSTTDADSRLMSNGKGGVELA